MGATRQSPAASGTDDSSTPGIHAPVSSVAIVPSPRPRYHSSLHPGVLESSPPSTRRFQLSAHFCEPSSCRSMVTSVPSAENGRPPACQIMLVAKPASPVSEVMYASGLAACSVSAAATYWSYVVGTAMPYWSKTVLL